jgi:hypothetical protein
MGPPRIEQLDIPRTTRPAGVGFQGVGLTIKTRPQVAAHH